MKLTEDDYQKIASRVEVGHGYIEYEKDGFTLCLSYTYYEDGYVENDYYRGTGAYVKTSDYLDMKVVDLFDEEGDEIVDGIDFDVCEVCKFVA